LKTAYYLGFIKLGMLSDINTSNAEEGFFGF
jgi:hypothetical protein